jgi:hypothetical protein
MIRDQDQAGVAAASRRQAFGTALTELVLTIALIASTVMVLTMAGISGAMATTRSDLIMMEESASSSVTTAAILIVIAVVMGVLTILALRDVAPAQSKRGNRRTLR